MGQLILWAAILVGWFFLLRMSEFLATNSNFTPSDRHPLHMGDIQPLRKGSPTHWGGHVGEISVHISGSKTDWLNQGCARSHTLVGDLEPNSDICVVRAFIAMFKEPQAKFGNSGDAPLATWRISAPIPDG